jgi:hypothetical protein
MSDNGWPGKPGVPLNPERDGWHWVSGIPHWWRVFDDDEAPLWQAHHLYFTAEEWSHKKYGGPVLTPAEVETHKHAAVIAYANLLNLPAPPNLIAQARRNALEEAALAAENEPEPEGDPPPKLHGRSVKNIATASVRATKHNIAAAIRALAKEEGDD